MANVDYGSYLLSDWVPEPDFGIFDVDLVVFHVYSERAADYGGSEAVGVAGAIG
jgi:hypothetical protein